MIEISVAIIVLFSIAFPVAVHEKNALLKHPKTWKGEMLCPESEPNCEEK